MFLWKHTFRNRAYSGRAQHSMIQLLKNGIILHSLVSVLLLDRTAFKCLAFYCTQTNSTRESLRGCPDHFWESNKCKGQLRTCPLHLQRGTYLVWAICRWLEGAISLSLCKRRNKGKHHLCRKHLRGLGEPQRSPEHEMAPHSVLSTIPALSCPEKLIWDWIYTFNNKLHFKLLSSECESTPTRA